MEQQSNKSIIFFYNKGSFFISHRMHFALYLIKKKYKIYLVSNCSSNESKEIKDNGIILIKKLNARNLNIFNFIKNIYLIKNILKKNKPDICEFASHSMNLLGLYATLFTNLKTVFWITGMGSFFIQKNYLNKILKFIILQSYKLNKFNNNSKFIIENRDDYKYLIDKKYLKENKLFLIPGAGVDKNLFLKHPFFEIKKNNIILMPCRIIKHKGIIDFIKVADYFLKLKNFKFRFILLGSIDSENPSSISKNDILKIKNHPLIEWHEHTNNVIKYYRETLLMLYLSYREGFPKTINEALMMNIPVISYDVIGCKDLIIDEINGRLIKFQNINKLCDTVYQLVNNLNIIEKYSKNARNSVVNKFSNDQVFKKTLKVYNF